MCKCYMKKTWNTSEGQKSRFEWVETHPLFLDKYPQYHQYTMLVLLKLTYKFDVTTTKMLTYFFPVARQADTESLSKKINGRKLSCVCSEKRREKEPGLLDIKHTTKSL